MCISSLLQIRRNLKKPSSSIWTPFWGNHFWRGINEKRQRILPFVKLYSAKDLLTSDVYIKLSIIKHSNEHIMSLSPSWYSSKDLHTNDILFFSGLRHTVCFAWRSNISFSCDKYANYKCKNSYFSPQNFDGGDNLPWKINLHI